MDRRLNSKVVKTPVESMVFFYVASPRGVIDRFLSTADVFASVLVVITVGCVMPAARRLRRAAQTLEASRS